MSRSAHLDLPSDSLQSPPPPGGMVAHYKLLERIDTRPSGSVYRARDTKLGRTVAVELLSPSLTGASERRRAILEQACRVMELSHPSISTLFDVGEADASSDAAPGTIYLVFEHVEGRLLGTATGAPALGIRQAVDFGVQLADALAEAHGHGLAHGAVRPETIFVTLKDRAKLLAFGLSQVLSGEPVVEGPPAGEGDRADIRGLGRVLFTMLTGRPPTNPLRIEPETGGRALPEELVPIVRRALADDDSRYLSAATLAAELRSVAAILDVRMAAGEAELVRETASRTRWAAAVLVAFLLSGLLVSAYLWRSELAGAWRSLFGSSAAVSSTSHESPLL